MIIIYYLKLFFYHYFMSHESYMLKSNFKSEEKERDTTKMNGGIHGASIWEWGVEF